MAKLSLNADRFRIMDTFRAKSGRDILVICASRTHHGHTGGHCFDLDARTKHVSFGEPNLKPALGFVFPWGDERNGLQVGGAGHWSYCLPIKSYKLDHNGNGVKDLAIRMKHGLVKGSVWKTSSERTIRRGWKTVKLLFDGKRLKLKGRPPCDGLAPF